MMLARFNASEKITSPRPGHALRPVLAAKPELKNRAVSVPAKAANSASNSSQTVWCPRDVARKRKERHPPMTPPLLAVRQLGQASGNSMEEIKPLAASSQTTHTCHLVLHAQDECLFNSFYAGQTNVSLPPLTRRLR